MRKKAKDDMPLVELFTAVVQGSSRDKSIPGEPKKDYKDSAGRCLAVYHGKVKSCTGFEEFSKIEDLRCRWWGYDICAQCTKPA